MDLTSVIAELRREREQVEEAILALERLAIGQGRRRGRSPTGPARPAEPTPAPRKRRGRPPGSKNKPKVQTEG